MRFELRQAGVGGAEFEFWRAISKIVVCDIGVWFENWRAHGKRRASLRKLFEKCKEKTDQ